MIRKPVETDFVGVVEKKAIMKGVHKTLKKNINSLLKFSPFGDGKAGEMIAEAIVSLLEKNKR